MAEQPGMILQHGDLEYTNAARQMVLDQQVAAK
jgi:hypothetical protein